jgi:hypothetical protein
MPRLALKTLTTAASSHPMRHNNERTLMFQFLEILMQILRTMVDGLIVWVLWPLLSALVAALNAIVHYFTH